MLCVNFEHTSMYMETIKCQKKNKYYRLHFLLKNRPKLSHKEKLAKKGGWNIRSKDLLKLAVLDLMFFATSAC